MDAVMADVAQSGPNSGGQDAVATTAWKFSWTFATSDNGDSCSLSNPVMSLSITYLYPQLTTPASAALGPWNAFMRSTVIPHEEHHKDIALNGAAELLRDLPSVGPATTCAALQAEAQDLGRAAQTKTKQQQDAFDRAAG